MVKMKKGNIYLPLQGRIEISYFSMHLREKFSYLCRGRLQ